MTGVRENDVGCVAIGRNEGPRLRLCLTSVLAQVDRVIYVDSGSTDDSVAIARSMGVQVVELDPARPFTAARARNEGQQQLAKANPGLQFVQFVDGDCELLPNWVQQARAALTAQPSVAAVCGRIRERRADQSIYNRLCDIEWAEATVGDIDACGGNALWRTDVLARVGGFDPTLIAGEEADLCVRVRRGGHRIVRLPDDMVSHDMAMERFSQWWTRSVRTGHAYAEGAHRYGREPERLKVRECRRAWLMGAVVPAVAFGAALPTLGGSSLLLLSYPASAARIYRRLRKQGLPTRDAALYGAFVTVSKIAEAQGVLRYHWGRLTGRRAKIIEHKTPTA